MEGISLSSDEDEYTSTNEDSEYLTSFYRIIMPSDLREYRLVLPKEFVAEYGKELSRTIRLEPCVGGDIWHIKLKKSGSLLCLQDGLENFMKHHSIGIGYFLIFKYKGNSEFDLHIFDLTATEIDCSKTSRQKLPGHHAKTIKIENDEPFPDAFVANHQPQEGGGVSSKRKAYTEFPSRKMQNQQSVNSKQFGFTTTSDSSCKRNKFSMRDDSKSHLVKKEATWNQEGERRKDNPFCSLQLTDSNVTRYNMYLPTQFSRENMKDYAEYIVLQDSDDPTRRWPVHCRKYDFRWSLCKGWSNFVKAKRLQEGDECVFEIMAKGIIKVSVFHTKSDGDGDGDESPCNMIFEDEEEEACNRNQPISAAGCYLGKSKCY